MATNWLWTGPVTHDSARINARITGATGRLLVSPNESLQFPTYYGPVTADSRGIVKFHVTDLEPGVEYFTAVESTPSTNQELRLNGSNAYALTPDHADLNITGDIDLRAEVRLNNVSTEPRLISKFGTTGDQCSYQMFLSTAGYLRLVWSTTGSSAGAPGRTSTVPVPWTAGGRIGVRAALQTDYNGQHRVTFYTSTNWSTWTQLGTPVDAAGVTSIFASTTPVSVGARTTPAANYLNGSVIRAEIRNGIDGTVIAAPDFREGGNGWLPGNNAATPAVADLLGKPWTIAGDGVIIADGGGAPTVDTTWTGRCRTHSGPPGTPVSHKIATWSCSGLRPRFPGAAPYVSNSPVFEAIDEHRADMLAITGDIHYGNIRDASPAPYRAAFEAVLSRDVTPRLSRHLAQNSTQYIWDDHDFGPNDSDRTNPGRPYAAQVYREYVPNAELVEEGAIYRAQQVGRV
ncbi:MAG: hypothetical protein ACRD0P_15430, partial [Stackebrandtia sp.]